MFQLRKNLFLMVCLVTTLSVFLGACGAATSAPTEAVAEPTAAAVEPTAAAEPTEAAKEPTPSGSEAAAPSGELIAVRQDEPATFDWRNLSAEPDTWIGHNIMEGLTDRDPNVPDGVPVLAESWEWDGDLIWTFHLRQGVKFHNGEPFNADAVVYSWSRIIDPDENAMLSNTVPIEYVKALDEYTVEVKTKEFDPIFSKRPTAARIVPPKYAEENPDLLSTQPIGTGPYKLVEWKKGEYVKLTANEEYWGEVPKIKDITILFREEPSVRAAMVQTGEADLAWIINPEDMPNVPKVVQYEGLTAIVMRVDTTGQNPALADVRVRQAMLYAVDTKTAMGTLFENVAVQVKGNQQVAPAVLGYDPDMEPWPYDPEKAKELVAEAQADGVPVDTEIIVYERGVGWFPRDNEFAEYLVNAWNEIGLNAKLEVMDTSAWIEFLYAVKPEENHGDLLYFLHSNEMMDWSGSALRFFYSDGNLSLWQDAETDRLLDIANALTGEERVKAYQDVAHYLEDKVPFLSFGSMIYTHATNANLVWEPRPDGAGNFADMSWAEN